VMLPESCPMGPERAQPLESSGGCEMSDTE
jgi:hypothetical protein